MISINEIRDRAKRGRTTLDDAEALLAELDAARAAVGEGWFSGGATLAEAITRKCRMLERNNEMACENTPWPGCECPGCETARERAEAALKGGSDAA